MGIVQSLGGFETVLREIGPIVSVCMFIIAGLVYAFGTMQPAEERGKYKAWAISMFVGAVIVAAMVGGATFLKDEATTFIGNSTTKTP